MATSLGEGSRGALGDTRLLGGADRGDQELTAFRGILIAGSVSALLWGIGFALMRVLR